MTQNSSSQTTAVVGPLGLTLTLENLPPPHTKRWVSRRKAEVVVAVNSGLLSLEEACERYRLSQEEFMTWSRAFRIYGLSGLHVTRVQAVRALRRAKSSDGGIDLSRD